MQYPIYYDLSEFVEIINKIAIVNYCKPSHFEIEAIEKDKWGWVYEVKLDDKIVAKMFPLPF